jgi:hypothetical protein
VRSLEVSSSTGGAAPKVLADAHDIREELKDDAAGLVAADRHVEEDLGPDGSRSGGVG